MLSRSTHYLTKNLRLTRTLSRHYIVSSKDVTQERFNQAADEYSSFAKEIFNHNKAIWDVSCPFSRQRASTVVEAIEEMTDQERAYLNFLIISGDIQVQINDGVKAFADRVIQRKDPIPAKIVKNAMPNAFENIIEDMTISKFMNSTESEGGGGTGETKDEGEVAEQAAEPEPEIIEKKSFSVKITVVPADKKLSAIKEVKSILGVGLKDAKEMVEALPAEIKADANKEESEALRERIEKLGCTVEVS